MRFCWFRVDDFRGDEKRCRFGFQLCFQPLFMQFFNESRRELVFVVIVGVDSGKVDKLNGRVACGRAFNRKIFRTLSCSRQSLCKPEDKN